MLLPGEAPKRMHDHLGQRRACPERKVANLPEIVVYTLPTCIYCHLVLRLLRGKGVSLREIGVQGDVEKRRWLEETTGQRTLPQVFIGGEPYGGYSDVALLDREGRLDALLGLAGA